jgi:putative flippase GtrA
MKLTHQLKRFLITGSINTGFAYLMYVFGVVVLEFSYFWSVVFSWCLGVIFSYIMFRAFVFTEGDRSWRSFGRFLPTYVALLAVNLAVMHVLVGIEDWNKLLAQAFVVPVCAVLSFIINRIFVFK